MGADEVAVCRFCRRATKEPLFRPCACGPAHPSCHNEWRSAGALDWALTGCPTCCGDFTLRVRGKIGAPPALWPAVLRALLPLLGWTALCLALGALAARRVDAGLVEMGCPPEGFCAPAWRPARAALYGLALMGAALTFRALAEWLAEYTVNGRASEHDRHYVYYHHHHHRYAGDSGACCHDGCCSDCHSNDCKCGDCKCPDDKDCGWVCAVAAMLVMAAVALAFLAGAVGSTASLAFYEARRDVKARLVRQYEVLETVEMRA
jgi:hypothetical protein